EANWLDDLMKEENLTLAELVDITGESESWINQRLALFRGDKEVFKALEDRQIALGHATILNRFPDVARKMYLEQVVLTTPPVRLLEQWWRDYKALGLENVKVPGADQAAQQGAVMPGVVVDCCVLCKGNQAVWDLKYVRVHGLCLDTLQKALDGGNTGG